MKGGPERHRQLTDEWPPSRNGDLSREQTLRDVTATGTIAKLRVWWRCSDCGSDWKALPRRRRLGKDNCPQCIGISPERR